MLTRHLRKFCQISAAGQELLRAAMTKLDLSARAYDRILKVSSTIADLENASDIKEPHLSEAIQYQTQGLNLWVLTGSQVSPNRESRHPGKRR